MRATTSGATGGSLVIQTSFLGDTILTTPLLAQLAERGPVDVVVTPASAPLLAGSPDVRTVIVYDKRGAARGASGFLRLARTLRASRYARAYLAQGSMRSAALAVAAAIPERVGFATSAGRRLYTRRVDYIESDHHAIRLLRLAGDGAATGAPTPSIRPRLHPSAADEASAEALLAANGLTSGAPMVALAPGSVWETKRWPYYAELAQLLAPVAHLVIVGAVADRPLAAAIVAAMPASAAHRAVDATGRLSLLGSAALIARTRAIVTNDSSPLHLASAMNTPTIAIFGPTVPAFGFGPLADVAIALGEDALPCRPCDRHGPRRCPLGHWRCMREINPARIAALVREIVERPS